MPDYEADVCGYRDPTASRHPQTGPATAAIPAAASPGSAEARR